MPQPKSIDTTRIDELLGKVDAGADGGSATYLTSQMRSRLQRQAARRPRSSSLNRVIEECVRQNGDISAKELLRELEAMAGKGGTIVEVTDEDEIVYLKDNGKEVRANVSGLDDRLSRAKKIIRKAG